MPLRDVPKPPENDSNQTVLLRLLQLATALRSWAYGHWLRSSIVAGVILAMIAATMAGWAFLANVALQSGQVSLEELLRALDEGRHEEARAGAARALRKGLLPQSDFGGPLFVLGAAKFKDAENQGDAKRRQTEFLIASRYLREADSYGFPAERASEGQFLLGKSLVESGQFDDGIRTLEELVTSNVSAEEPLGRIARRYLADTYLVLPNPKPEMALPHYMALLNADCAEEERIGLILSQSDCLARLKKFDEARKVISSVPLQKYAAEVGLLRSVITLDELEHSLQRPGADPSKVLVEIAEKIAEAMKQLQQVATLDVENGSIPRQARYQLGRGYELQGQREVALQQYVQTRQLYGDSFEGLAAALAEADLLRMKGEIEPATLAYRRVLETFSDIPIYHGKVLSLVQLRTRMMNALKDLVDRQRFVETLALLDQVIPLFSREEQLELRGSTLEQWGSLTLSQSNAEQRNADRTSGLQRLRAAGVAYEQLAELRFATRFYTSDLWKSAENYFRGHNFTRTINLLNEYLEYEPQLRHAEALVRLGQSHLALGQLTQSIEAFEECIEFYPLDSSSFQARIDCAKAHWYTGNFERAEQLLRDNLSGSSLKPASPEWRDSLFELGMLLHEKGQYEGAIAVLEEAVERYPQDTQRLLAQYFIGESYRRAAQRLLEQVSQARTGSERDKSRQTAKDQLLTALNHFEEVQRAITIKTHDIRRDPLLGTMLRNCYMLQGTVLFDLGSCDPDASERRYREAIEAFSNVASLYPDNPFVLETFVQIANCWRRLGRNDNARGAIQQAQIALDRLPADADFASTTARSRDEWRMLLADMSKW
jgi:tetratricopeptide (TPR) repeat protein